jgi:hypothetical protein
VGATNERDQITGYCSYGAGGQRKPDIVAPGGSDSTGRALVVLDTNSGDPSGTGSGTVPSQFPNDYGVWPVGTSFAAPQAAGAAMLVAQAMGTWSFTEAQALSVKMVLLMTASETGSSAELGPGPDVSRGGKDVIEGFGRLNVDAAVEAVSQSFTPGGQASGTLGANVVDKRVWARSVSLNGGTNYSFTLTNPGGADYDLYLYSNTPVTVGSSAGEPQIVASSARPGGGGTESLQFRPTSTDRYYLVVKQVSGGGTFQITSSR